VTVLKELAVVVREYTDRDGNQKKVWVQIGTLNETAKGQYIALDRHINLAGIPVSKEGDSRVYVMLLDPKPKPGAKPAPMPQHVRDAAGGAYDDLGNDIPF
jgi:hypothetical protein